MAHDLGNAPSRVGRMIDRQKPKSWIGSWSSPVPVMVDGKQQILVAMPRHVKCFMIPAMGDHLVLRGERRLGIHRSADWRRNCGVSGRVWRARPIGLSLVVRET